MQGYWRSWSQPCSVASSEISHLELDASVCTKSCAAEAMGNARALRR